MAGETIGTQAWTDFYHVSTDLKVHILCCSDYCNIMRRRNRRWDRAILISSVVSLAVCKYFPSYVWIPSLITAIMLGLKEIKPVIIQDDKELCDIDEIRTKFELILSNLENAVASFESNPLFSEVHFIQILHENKREMNPCLARLDKLQRKVYNQIENQKIAQEYLDIRYGKSSSNN